jgi:hypothetical protein
MQECYDFKKGSVGQVMAFPAALAINQGVIRNWSKDQSIYQRDPLN